MFRFGKKVIPNLRLALAAFVLSSTIVGTSVLAYDVMLGGNSLVKEFEESKKDFSLYRRK